MITSRTVIGIVAGAAIIGLGVASLVAELAGEPLQITETFEVGEVTSYQITGDAGAVHAITVTAERFEMELASPGDGLVIPRTEFAGQHHQEWSHQEAGRTTIRLQNTGGTEMVVEGSFSVSTDPIFFAYHIVVITSGVVIIGFSLVFSLRKPRGF